MPEIPPPPCIPDFELIVRIGSGSYGDVWLARGITGLYRAIKIVRRERFRDDEPYEREFNGLREFAAISLTAPNQLKLLHTGRNDAAGFFFYVMELADDVAGDAKVDAATYRPRTLGSRRKGEGRLPIAEVVTLAADLARALEGLHSRGLVHRDIKPSNVIFVAGAPKLADIGLVSATAAGGGHFGTEGFIAPEGPGLPTADVYSLGKLLYEAATGLDRREFPRLPANLSEFPGRAQLLALNNIIVRACDPNPDARHPDATALLSDLERIQPGAPRAGRRPFRWALQLGATGAALAAFAVAIAMDRRADASEEVRRVREAVAAGASARAVYVVGIARAQRALDLGNYGVARAVLRDLSPRSGAADMRGVEWRLLWGEARGDPATIIQESGAAIERLRYAPDGSRLVVHAADHRAVVWDCTLNQAGLVIPSVAAIDKFRTNSDYLMATRTAGYRTWVSVRTGQWMKDAHLSPFREELAVYPEQRYTVVAADSPTPAIVARSTGNQVAWSVPLGLAGPSAACVFRSAASGPANLAVVIVASSDAGKSSWQLYIVDLVERVVELELPLAAQPSDLALSPDGASVAIAYPGSGEVELLRTADGSLIWRKAVGASRPEVLAYAPDGSAIAIGGRDAAVSLVASTDGSVRRTLHGPSGSITALEWSADGRFLASGTSTGDARLWSEPLRARARLQAGAADDDLRAEIHANRDGSRLAVAGPNASVSLLLTESRSVEFELPGSAAPVGFADVGQTLITLTPAGHIRRWLINSESPRSEVFPLFGGGGATRAALTADGRWLAAADARGRIQLWDWIDRRPVREWAAPGGAAEVLRFSSAGTTLLSVGADQVIRAWDVATGHLRLSRPVAGGLTSVAASSTDLIAAGSADGNIEVVAIPTGKRRFIRTGLSRANAVAFSPDGSRLVCGGPDGIVQVFVAGSDWQEIATLAATDPGTPGNTGVAGLEFSPNGRSLTALLANGMIRHWRE